MKKAILPISLLLISLLGAPAAQASCSHHSLENTRARGNRLSREIKHATRLPFVAVLGVGIMNVLAKTNVQIPRSFVSTAILAGVFGDNVGSLLNGYQRGADLLSSAWAWRQKRYGDLRGYGRAELARTARLVGTARKSEISIDLISDMIIFADLNESFCQADPKKTDKTVTFTRLDIVRSLIGNDDAFKYAIARSDAAADQIELLTDQDPTNDEELEARGTFTCLDLATSVTVEKNSQFGTRTALAGYALAMGSFVASMFTSKAVPSKVLFASFTAGALLNTATQPLNAYRKGYELLQAAHNAKEGSKLELLSNDTLAWLRRAAEKTYGSADPERLRQVAARIREADRKREFCPPIEQVDLDGNRTYHFKGYTHHDILRAIRPVTTAAE